MKGRSRAMNTHARANTTNHVPLSHQGGPASHTHTLGDVRKTLHQLEYDAQIWSRVTCN